MQRDRACHGLSPAIHAELACGVLDVKYNRALRDAEQPTYFPTGLAFGGPAKALELTRGQAHFGGGQGRGRKYVSGLMRERRQQLNASHLMEREAPIVLVVRFGDGEEAPLAAEAMNRHADTGPQSEVRGIVKERWAATVQFAAARGVPSQRRRMTSAVRDYRIDAGPALF